MKTLIVGGGSLGRCAPSPRPLITGADGVGFTPQAAAPRRQVLGCLLLAAGALDRVSTSKLLRTKF